MKTVLIIEDDIALSRMYAIKFSMDGFSVLTAYNGDDGLRILHGAGGN
jgi:DNA-binding response OmpR family regulator